VARSLAATASAVPILLGAAAMRAITGDKRASANLVTSTLSNVSLALSGVQVRVTGEEHLWSHRPAVFIFNHRNIADAQIVGSLVRRDFGAVAKKELEKNPLFAAASQFMHFAFVERDNTQAAIETLRPATRLLSEGYSMVVAPEGTRVTGMAVGPFKKGAFRMAMEAQVPLVPIILRNADDVAPRNSGTLRPGTVDVAVLPPISVTGWTLDTLEERIEEVRQLFVETLENWPAA
jgi:putative phosphoserine phosphatase/1-acylglycerol-3-phosphate O-acyltransferase